MQDDSCAVTGSHMEHSEDLSLVHLNTNDKTPQHVFLISDLKLTKYPCVLFFP